MDEETTISGGGEGAKPRPHGATEGASRAR